jgi:hypothetical protein
MYSSSKLGRGFVVEVNESFFDPFVCLVIEKTTTFGSIIRVATDVLFHF